ncbi:hypothetical protein GWO13_03785 [Candidatus Bathyarchaeota archaeon]|nr:hypothetical protein [Candidatus Bathyarchaeota archaeon]
MKKQVTKRKKKKLKQSIVLKEEETVNQTSLELLSILESLEKEGKYVDVRVCPRCKSPRVRRVGAMNGDMSGHMAVTPVKFECLDCGWRERLVLRATNRPMGLKEVALIAEALELK